jgi:hypothetical protein
MEQYNTMPKSFEMKMLDVEECNNTESKKNLTHAMHCAYFFVLYTYIHIAYFMKMKQCNVNLNGMKETTTTFLYVFICKVSF